MAATVISLKDRRKKDGDAWAEMAALPFVAMSEGPIRKLDLWSVVSTGEDIPDERFGELCARAMLQCMQTGNGSFLLFQNVIAAMIDKGRCDRIEIGFLQAIGAKLADCRS